MSWVRESASVWVTSWSRTVTAWAWRRISTGTVACAAPRGFSRGERLPGWGGASPAGFEPWEQAAGLRCGRLRGDQVSERLSLVGALDAVQDDLALAGLLAG